MNDSCIAGMGLAQFMSIAPCNSQTLYISLSQEVGGTLIGEDRPVVMTGGESVEWYQIHQAGGLMPFHLLRSSHYYEPSSPQQPPLICFSDNQLFLHPLLPAGDGAEGGSICQDRIYVLWE
jgi:hypothetical protein